MKFICQENSTLMCLNSPYQRSINCPIIKSFFLGITGDDWPYSKDVIPSAWRITLMDSKENKLAEKVAKFGAFKLICLITVMTSIEFTSWHKWSESPYFDLKSFTKLLMGVSLLLGTDTGIISKVDFFHPSFGYGLKIIVSFFRYRKQQT